MGVGLEFQTDPAGAKVTKVIDGSRAAAVLAAGDIITAVNGKSLAGKSEADMKTALSGAGDGAFNVSLLKNATVPAEGAAASSGDDGEAVRKQYLEQLIKLRATLEEERKSVHKEMTALREKVASLEKKGVSKAAAPAAPAAAAGAPAGKVPFGHTPFSWQGQGPLAAGKVPFGHTPFSWGEASGGASAGASVAVAEVPRGVAGKQGYMSRYLVREVLASDLRMVGQEITVCGWARTVRLQANNTLAFIDLNDGSSFAGIQCVVLQEADGFAMVSKERVTGTCFRVDGLVVESPGANQNVELKATKVTLLGSCPADTYPLAKGRHPLEHLRTIQHIRPRTNTIGAMLRVRNALAFAVHSFYQQRGFYYVHAPLITASDCEGAGETFSVSTIFKDDPKQIPVTPDGKVDFTKDFFEKRTFLTVSGQLEAEAYACSMGKVYTFGPTFRAENSHGPRHLSEFWMIEPEIAFADLGDVMDLGEDFLKFLGQFVVEHCPDELAFCDKMNCKGLIERLKTMIATPFARMPYTEAMQHLVAAKKKWEFKPSWGEDLATEHERFLTEEIVKGPVYVTDWPKDIKSFYMRLNDDNKTVAAMDCLLPKVGEIIGGSQREERLDTLLDRMRTIGVPEENLSWYLDLRRYGTCPHAGFGLGFERMVMYCTGLENIRDAIPFPRFPGPRGADF